MRRAWASLKRQVPSPFQRRRINLSRIEIADPLIVELLDRAYVRVNRVCSSGETSERSDSLLIWRSPACSRRRPHASPDRAAAGARARIKRRAQEQSAIRSRSSFHCGE
jgi:hypothetical protein